jgi:hypothetical protein
LVERNALLGTAYKMLKLPQLIDVKKPAAF